MIPAHAAKNLSSPIEGAAMRRQVIVLCCLILLPSFSFSQEAKKRPIPTAEAQAKIEKLLLELYQDDLLKAEKDPVVRGRLAQTLLFEGKETKDDAAGRFVLLSKAQRLAAEAGDIKTALEAADELAHDYIIPAGTIFQMKIKMLKQASQVVGAAADSYQSVVDRSLLILEDTLDADDYPSSLELIAAAELAARKLKSLSLVASMRRKQDEIIRLEKEFARWHASASKLATDPQDAAANLEMGQYYALVKGNWERGLPLLAKGSKSNLAKLGQSDLAMPDTPGGRRVVALGWFLFANAKTTDPAMKTQALLRAYHWYQENLTNAKDEQRVQIETKLLEVAELLPAEYRLGEITSELKKIDIFSGPVYGCAFSPDGKRFAATGYDGAVRIFNARTFQEIRQLDGHVGKVWSVAFSADGKHVASGGFDNSVRFWDLSTGAHRTFEGHKDYVRSVAISGDGKRVLSGGDDRAVCLWNVETGKEERLMTGHNHTVWGVALSRDGKLALSASLDKTARFWDVEKGTTIQKLEGHKDTVLCVAFTPDGRHAVTGSTDKTLRLWDLASGRTIRVFEGSGGYIHSVAVSGDGRRILSAGADNVVRLWDAHTGKEIRKLEGHRDQVWHVAFSRDGRQAISSGQDNCIRLWTGSR
jgi:hypothetical protein